MLLAQVLICHKLGRSWRWNSSQSNSREYLEILQCFGDSSSQDCPFSIHNILTVGGPYGLVAGYWLGPYALCRSLEALARERSKNGRLDPVLPVHIYVVSGDADGERGGAPCICIDDVASFCTDGDGVGDWAPVLLLIPLVLGLDKLNPRYLPSLWATFSFPQSVGIAGGKPGASTYLVGVQDDQVFYLDPHEVQQAFTVSPDDMEVDTSSYHCSAVKQMPLSAVDPSLALGFYCRNREDFDDLCKRASELARESNGAPMFTVAKWSNKGGQTEKSTEMQDLYFHDNLANFDDIVIASEEEWQVVDCK